MSVLPDLRPPRRDVRARLTARDVMTPDVITVRPETTVKDVAALMVRHHISGLSVLADGTLVGIVTEADLLHKERGPRPPAGWVERAVRSCRRAVGLRQKADGLTAARPLGGRVPDQRGRARRRRLTTGSRVEESG